MISIYNYILCDLVVSVSDQDNFPFTERLDEVNSVLDDTASMSSWSVFGLKLQGSHVSGSPLTLHSYIMLLISAGERDNTSY